MDYVHECLSMEDSVQALLDHLVDPLLKSLQWRAPSLPTQQAVSKQIYAVVLLYNYYHRKIFPELEYLDYDSFCKMSVIAKPSLLPFMKSMSRSNNKFGDSEKKLSITEQMVMEACNVCLDLHESNKNPNSHTWPFSKVAILIVDSSRKACLLQSCTSTPRMWSLLEREIDVNSYKMDEVSRNESNRVEREKHQASGEVLLHDVAFSLVKEKTGINQKDLILLEEHSVYCLDKAKSMSRFYIMQFIASFSEELQKVPVKDVLSSASGPLFMKSLGGYAATAAVEYFHLFPYVAFVSDWFSRGTCQKFPVQHSMKLDGTISLGAKLSSSKVDETNNSGQLPVKDSMKTDGTISLGEKLFSKRVNQTDNSGPCVVNTLGNGHVSANGENINAYSSMNGSYSPSSSTSKKEAAIFGSFRNTALSSIDHTAKGSPTMEMPIASTGVLSDMCRQKTTTSLQHCDKSPAGSIIEKVKFTSEANVKACSSPDSGHFIWKTAVLSTEPHVSQSPVVHLLPNTDGNLNTQNGDDNDHCGQANLLKKDNDICQAALLTLKMKRDELVQQQRLLEDEIAECEKHIQELTSVDDDINIHLASIVEAYSIAILKGVSHIKADTHCGACGEHFPRNFKRRRLSEALLKLQCSCQELDDICSINNWALPRYRVFPSNGGFLSDITVEGGDFESSCRGSRQSTPCDARESAADAMLDQLRRMSVKV